MNENNQQEKKDFEQRITKLEERLEIVESKVGIVPGKWEFSKRNMFFVAIIVIVVVILVALERGLF